MWFSLELSTEHWGIWKKAATGTGVGGWADGDLESNQITTNACKQTGAFILVQYMETQWEDISASQCSLYVYETLHPSTVADGK